MPASVLPGQYLGVVLMGLWWLYVWPLEGPLGALPRQWQHGGSSWHAQGSPLSSAGSQGISKAFQSEGSCPSIVRNSLPHFMTYVLPGISINWGLKFQIDFLSLVSLSICVFSCLVEDCVSFYLHALLLTSFQPCFYLSGVFVLHTPSQHPVTGLRVKLLPCVHVFSPVSWINSFLHRVVSCLSIF